MVAVWLSSGFQIGTSIADLTHFKNVKSVIDFDERILKQIGRDSIGELRVRNMDKIVSKVNVDIEFIKKSDLDILNKIINSGEIIYIRAFSDEKLEHKEYRVSLTRNYVKIMPTSRRFITIEKVVLKSDETGTNYYSGGSFDEETYSIILGQQLPVGDGNNQEVAVYYSYAGWCGAIEGLKISSSLKNRSDYFNVSFTIEGK